MLKLTPDPDDTKDRDAFEAWWNQQLATNLDPLLSEPSVTLVAVPQLIGVVEKIASGMAVADKAPVIADLAIKAWQALLRAAHASREDLFFVWDAPQDPAVARTCIEQLQNEASLGELGQHAALYGPHLLTDYESHVDDPYASDGYRLVPPSGAVLGLIARTDLAAGVWKAPANDALWHVLKPQYRETQTSGWFDMSKPTINLIRSFPGRGTRVWGCRTLAGTTGSPFRYVQVRRMVTWIEANLREVCRFAVFEPNNEVTWFQLRGLCNAWLRRVWLEGGLAGADESAAYSVQVGLNESMTQVDIDAGRLLVKIGVAVLHAAEFININLVLKSGDASAGDAQRVEGETV
ncbi:hypothetical protein WT71_16250 [Burkholderia stagnalis]|nr:hypothetical protein WT71_16250 [Burkholderia stagnalis]KWI71000.1 hypothetical protein WT73_14035 [Burkholderia stagnalis]